MLKSYLRYRPKSVHGIIASPGCTIATDPSGRLAFTGELENVGVWNIRRGVQIQTLTPPGAGDNAPKAEATCIEASPNGKHVAVGYGDGMIRLYDYTKNDPSSSSSASSGTSNLSMSLNGHGKAVTSLCFTPDGTQLASGSKDTDTILWDLVAETGVCRLRGHKDEVTDVVFVPKPSSTSLSSSSLSSSSSSLVSKTSQFLLVTSSKDTTLKVWDLLSRRCVQTIVGARVEVWSLCVPACKEGESPRVIAGTGDNRLRVWSVGTRPVKVTTTTTTTTISTSTPSSTASSEVAFSKKKNAEVTKASTTPASALSAVAASLNSSSSKSSSSSSSGSATTDDIDASVETGAGGDVEYLTLMGTLTRQTNERVSSLRATVDGRFMAVQCAGKTVEILRRRTPNEVSKRVIRRLRRQREKITKKTSSSSSMGGAEKQGQDSYLDTNDTNNDEDDDDGFGFAGTSLAELDAQIRRLEAEATASATAAAIANKQTKSSSSSNSADDNGLASSSSFTTSGTLIVASDEWELVGIASTHHRVSSFGILATDADDFSGSNNNANTSSSSSSNNNNKAVLNLLLALSDNEMEVHSLPIAVMDGSVSPTSASGAEILANFGAKSIMTAAGFSVPQAVVKRTMNLQGHRSDIRAVAISSDGALMLSCSAGQAKVWNAKTGAALRTLELGGGTGSGGAAAAAAAAQGTSSDAGTVGLTAAFCPGNRHAVIGCKDGRLLLFDLASSDLLEQHTAHSGTIWSLSMRPDGKGLCTGSADKEVKFWDFDIVTKTVSPNGDDDGEEDNGGGGASSSKKKPQQQKPVASNKQQATVQVLTLIHVRTLKVNDEVLCVKYSHHKESSRMLVAVALMDATIKVFFEDTLKFALSLYGHKLPVMAMDISADSTLLISASADKTVKVWGLDFGDVHKSFLAHGDSVTSVGFVANTHYFFTCSKDKSVKYWDGDRFEQILTLDGHKGEVWCLAVSPDGSYFATGSHDRSLRIWTRTEEQVFLEEEREKELEAVMERELRDPDGEAAFHGAGMDFVGAIGSDGLAVTTDKDETGNGGGGAVQTTAIGGRAGGGGGGAPEASTVIAHSTRDTMKGADRLLEALALATQEEDKWIEYSQDLADARAAHAKVAAAGAKGAAALARVLGKDGVEEVEEGGGGGGKKKGKHADVTTGAGSASATTTRPEDEVPAPTRNPELLGLTPSMYVLRSMRALRPSDVDQVLLTLPFADAVRLLRFLHHCLRKGQGIELCSRAALLLLRMHHAQISSSARMVPLVLGLREAMQSSVQAAKDRVGFVVAGLKFMDKNLADVGAVAFGAGNTSSEERDAFGGKKKQQDGKKRKNSGAGGSASGDGGKGDGLRIGKRRNVKLL